MKRGRERGGVKEKKNRSGGGGRLINNCEAARCRSSGFSLQWAGAGISPSAVSVGLIREPLGT